MKATLECVPSLFDEKAIGVPTIPVDTMTRDHTQSLTG